MISEILAWLTAQNYWADPIFKVVLTMAAIKYILFSWR